jgi:hypothetical protein
MYDLVRGFPVFLISFCYFSTFFVQYSLISLFERPTSTHTLKYHRRNHETPKIKHYSTTIASNINAIKATFFTFKALYILLSA